MSLLPPVIFRDIGDEAPDSARVVYAAFIRHLESPTTPHRAMLRAAADTGVSRKRVLDIVRAENPNLFANWFETKLRKA